jgi:hypothetical protein
VQNDRQSSQPQHDATQELQPANPPQSLSESHSGAHVCDSKMQIWPVGHGSSSSHRPAAGTQAAMQSLQPKQLEVAQPSQIVPGPQVSPGSGQGLALLQPVVQVPVVKRQRPDAQSE